MYVASKEIKRVRQSKMQTERRICRQAHTDTIRRHGLTNRQALKRADIGRWLAHAVERRTDKQINVQER
jgi:hypothetical protein